MNQKEQITIKQVFPNESTSPTLLLFPTNTTNTSSNDENNKLQVLIETNDSNEMNLILNTIKNMFPSANVIRTCYQDNNLSPKETPHPPPTTTTTSSNNSKAYLSVTPTECKKATTERAASIDNSSLIISDSNSIERQESKDSGFWTRSKCSFESTKSLSIDVTAKSSQAVYINTTSTTTVTPTPTITPSPPKQEHLRDASSVSTQFNIKNNYLTSDSLSINSYNWKKWKKGQAWRYSNTNLSEQTNNNDTIRTKTTNNSFCSSDNSSFSFSIDRNEDESNESYTNTATTNNYFSNSFELATSKLSLQTNNQWSSSTSKLEILSNSNNTNSTSTSDSNINSSNNLINSQKRRGKLVRDRTIDNTDDHISNNNNNNNNKTSSNLNLNEDTANNIESREILTSSPIQNCDTTVAATLSKSGRISPPEKRLSISFKNNEFNNSLEHKLMDAANLTNEKLITFIKSDEFQTALYTTMPTSENQLKQTIAKLLAFKFQLNNNNNDDELIKYLIEKNVYLQTILQQRLQLQNRSSACPSPALSPLSTSNLIPNVNKLTLLTPPPSSKSPIQSNTQYDFHQDLQMKLNLKSNDTETSSSSSSFTPFQKVNNMQEQRLNANYTKMNSSFDFKYINNNYLSNNNNNNNKYMYRSNSSPSYSAALLNDADSMVLASQQQANTTDLNHFQQQPSNFLSSFAFNYNKSLPPQSASNYQQFLSNQPPSQQQQPIYYPINFIDSSKEISINNNNRLIKPPAIVITESEYNANTNNAPPPPPATSTNNENSKSTSEFNRNRFMNSSFHFNQSLESIMTHSDDSKNLQQQQSAKNLKPHVCGICQKRFARSDMLIRHSRLHSGVRPYRCNKCGQEFSRSDHLNTHLRTHTGEKPYVCPHCSYAACRKDMITRHLKVHSKNNNINNTINRQSSSFDSAAAAVAATSSLSLNTAPNNSYLFCNNIIKKNNLENSNHNFLFNGLTRMDVNNLENLKHKSMSSLTSF